MKEYVRRMLCRECFLAELEEMEKGSDKGKSKVQGKPCGSWPTSVRLVDLDDDEHIW